MVWGEPSRLRMLRQVGQAKRLPFLQHQPKYSFPLRTIADTVLVGLGDSGSYELYQRTIFAKDPKGAVPRRDQFAAKVGHLLEDCLKRQIRTEGPYGVV